MKDKNKKTERKSIYRSFAFKPSRIKDADLIEFLEKKGNVNAYLKELVYKDMKQK